MHVRRSHLTSEMLISSHWQFISLSLTFYSFKRNDTPFFKRQGNACELPEAVRSQEESRSELLPVA